MRREPQRYKQGRSSATSEVYKRKDKKEKKKLKKKKRRIKMGEPEKPK